VCGQSANAAFCQSRFYKEWHPDAIAAYNSLNDRHLRNYFNHPARVNHLTRNNQVRTFIPLKTGSKPLCY
jgi:hypothetical protein